MGLGFPQKGLTEWVMLMKQPADGWEIRKTLKSIQFANFGWATVETP